MTVKILVLAVNDRTTWMLSNAIEEVYPDTEVLLLSRQSKTSIFFSRLKNNGFLNATGQLLFILFSKFLLSKKNEYIA